MLPASITLAWEIAQLTPAAIRLIRDIIAAIRDGADPVAIRERALGTAAGRSAYEASKAAKRSP